MNLKNKPASKRFSIVLILLVALTSGYAQDLKFKRFNRDEGLSSVNAKTIFQDSDDFIWIGTQDGLNRYDGYHFKVFRSDVNDTTALQSSDINCMIQDKSGDIYLGTNGAGLSVFNKYTETFKTYTDKKNNLSNNTVLCLLDLNDTELLIGTADGLSVFNKNTKKAYSIAAPKEVNERLYISSMCKDSKGTIWVALPRYGLYKFNVNEKKLILYPFPEKITNNTKNDYYKQAIVCFNEFNNILYCGTFNGGVITFDIIEQSFSERQYYGEENSGLNKIRGIIKDKNGNDVWFASLGGLIKYNPQSRSHKIESNSNIDNTSISSNQLLCIFQDKQHNIWLGSEDKGISINISSSKKFTHYNKNQLNGNDAVYAFLETSDGLIWIGTDEGLYSFNRHTKEFTNRSDIIKKHSVSSVYSLLEDQNKNIWIGTEGAGIIFYDTKSIKSKIILNEKYHQGVIHKIVEDSKKQIWAATYNHGILLINPSNGNVISFNMENGLPTNIINDVFENKQDSSFWLSTQGGGICILKFDNAGKIIDKKNLNHQLNKNSISSDLVYSVFKDQENTFWIATNNGLNRYKDGKFTLLSENDGLPSNYVYSILQDKALNLWLTTNSGLSKYNPKNNVFVNYTVNNGIQSKEFNQGAAYKCKDGTMLVGGMNGFNYFDPEQIRENNYIPTIYLNSYLRQGNTVKTDTSILFKKHLTLSYQENYFTFEVTAIDYTSPENIKYMYLLKGYDHNWSSPTNVRYISYTELPGGNYTLLVKASNSDGSWSTTPFELHITVIPPWWKTTWFYVISGIIGLSMVFGFTSYRTNAVKKVNKVLETKVAERTSELATKNRDITSSIEYAKRIQEAILPAQDLIFSKLEHAFILYKPKDIVSGDFYWFGEKGQYKIIAVVDCTGHGVPGAFMSMIGHNLLNQIVSEKGNYDPGTILQELHKGVQAALKQGSNTVNTSDGMDVSLLAINTETGNCLWAGAFRSLIIVNDQGLLAKLEGNKYPVGGAQLDTERSFTTHTCQLQKNDMLYMFSDGYADQFGGERGKKFMVKHFHTLLTSIHTIPIKEQEEELERQFNTWKGRLEQVDDVLVLGIKY